MAIIVPCKAISRLAEKQEVPKPPEGKPEAARPENVILTIYVKEPFGSQDCVLRRKNSTTLSDWSDSVYFSNIRIIPCSSIELIDFVMFDVS